MPMTKVEDRITKLPMDEGLRVLNAGHDLTMGQPFQLAWAMACMGAQLCLECGNFQKAHCNNWQNQKIPKDWDGLYCTFKCDELFDVQTAHRAAAVAPGLAVDTGPWKGGPLRRVVLFPDHPWALFKAFEDEKRGSDEHDVEGAVIAAGEYVRLIACEHRYVDAWHEAVMGRPANFSRALHAAGYYTADPNVYTKGVVSIAEKIYDPCARIVSGEQHGIGDELRAFVMAQVTETLRGFGREPLSHDLVDFDAVA